MSATRDEAVGVSELKRRCLEYVERTRRTGQPLVITKHGRPVARLVPIEREGRSLRGSLRGEMVLRGEIVDFDVADDWETAR